MFSRLLAIVLGLFFVASGSLCAHPVPKDNHDRFITVRLLEGKTPDHLLLHIEYRLEVDEATVVLDDMKPYRDEVDASLFAKKPLDYYSQFTRIYAPIYAENLLVKINGEPVPLTLQDRNQTLKDEKGEPLGHLRCTFIFQGQLALGTNQENTLTVHETNYRDQEGQIHLVLVNDANLKIIQQTLPDLALNKLHPLDRPADYDNKLRHLSVKFVQGQETSKDTPLAEVTPPPAETRPTQEDHEGFLQLFRDVREKGMGLWLVLLLFAALGAAHALTPGHGKTLVAAYLVGEHGTIWHAVVLGVVTTITHTGVVLILAAVLFFLPASMAASAKDSIRTGLGLGMGLLVVCLGFWLLLQRLSGRADHIHLGGGHDHHHHGHPHHHHAHPPAALAQNMQQNGGLSWWGIIFLGMTGGLVPCWDAIVILATVVGTSEFWFALPALLAFSAGLAGVLVAIGILVVKFRNFAGSHWGEGRLVRSLPLLSAIFITAMGLWLCYESVHHP
jgi:nickel/cobalt exporter